MYDNTQKSSLLLETVKWHHLGVNIHSPSFDRFLRVSKHLKIRNVLTRRREYGTYLATARRHRRRIKMQKRDE